MKLFDPSKTALQPHDNVSWPWWWNGTLFIPLVLLTRSGSLATGDWERFAELLSLAHFGILGLLALLFFAGAMGLVAETTGRGAMCVLLASFFLLDVLSTGEGSIWYLAFIWALLTWGAYTLSRGDGVGLRLGMPLLLGATILSLWEAAVVVYDISPVILPAPSSIGAAIAANVPTLWADFVQTILRGALVGYVLGCGAAVLTALAIDRSVFLQKGLLPVGNFIAALPIVGTAPILVMWYGFGPSSKVAVVVAMVFFPMLVNAVQGLKTNDAIQRDLMHTYAASYGQTLIKLRLPTALPFLFNGLKICSTLALIGAIVAEFFGSPTVGMGFRIKIEVGRLAMDMVWAEITVAALAGSALYGLMALLERRLTFWHPSQRRARG